MSEINASRGEQIRNLNLARLSAGNTNNKTGSTADRHSVFINRVFTGKQRQCVDVCHCAKSGNRCREHSPREFSPLLSPQDLWRENTHVGTNTDMTHSCTHHEDLVTMKSSSLVRNQTISTFKHRAQCRSRVNYLTMSSMDLKEILIRYTN